MKGPAPDKVRLLRLGRGCHAAHYNLTPDSDVDYWVAGSRGEWVVKARIRRAVSPGGREPWPVVSVTERQATSLWHVRQIISRHYRELIEDGGVA